MSIFALIHSPLVGPLTWSLAAAALRRGGHTVIVPALSDAGDPGEPFWLRQSRSAARVISASTDRPVILVGHSGAGQLLPAIGARLGGPVKAYLFVDAGLPASGKSRLEQMAAEDAEFSGQLRNLLAGGGRFPDWTGEALQEVLPVPAIRRRLLAEIQPRGLDFFSEPIPAVPGWPDSPCVYLQFSPPYDPAARRAQSLGWPYRRIDAGHFHMLVNPEEVAQAMVELLYRYD